MKRIASCHDYRISKYALYSLLEYGVRRGTIYFLFNLLCMVFLQVNPLYAHQKSFCGDGIVNNNESCDGTAGVGPHQACSDKCKLVNLPYCGDGKINNDEECDGEKGTRKHQKCSAQCKVIDIPYCGDKIVNNNEQCDGKAGVGRHQGCSDHCTIISFHSCGNGVLNKREQCDGTAGVGAHQQCSDQCTLMNLSFCGDGVLQSMNDEGVAEQCDGTAGVGAHQQCSAQCTLMNLTYCGDGVFQAMNGEGVAEQCDGTAGVGAHQQCSAQCTLMYLSFCGDGVLQSMNDEGVTEQCDGNSGIVSCTSHGYNGIQECSSSCTSSCKVLEYCGDGTIQATAGETCDDGNKADHDGCSSTCVVEGCTDSAARRITVEQIPTFSTQIMDLSVSPQNGYAVWSEKFQGVGSLAIYRHDGIQTSLVSRAAAVPAQRNPTINSKGHVAWINDRGIIHQFIIGMEPIRFPSYSGSIATPGYLNVAPIINENDLVSWTNIAQHKSFIYESGITTELTRPDSAYNLDTGMPYDSFGHDFNNNGEVIWQQLSAESETNQIFYFDGLNTQALTSQGGENPGINDNSQMVWQSFDGHDDEIFLKDGENLFQITNNDYPDRNPQINNKGHIAWQGTVDGISQIFFYDGASVKQITQDNYIKMLPDINATRQAIALSDDDAITWISQASPFGLFADSRWDVFVYDGKNVHQLTQFNGTHKNIYPNGTVMYYSMVSDNVVYWTSFENISPELPPVYKLFKATICQPGTEGCPSDCLDYTHVCGNGIIEGNEGCDDGNNTGGDCCSSSCEIESAATCLAHNSGFIL